MNPRKPLDAQFPLQPLLLPVALWGNKDSGLLLTDDDEFRSQTSVVALTSYNHSGASSATANFRKLNSDSMAPPLINKLQTSISTSEHPQNLTKSSLVNLGVAFATKVLCRFALSACIWMLIPSPAHGQNDLSASATILSGESATAAMLRNQPEKDYEFNRASLRDVLRFLASDAGISYVSVPEVEKAEDRLVTFTLRASPFRALEVIAKANGVALFYEDGVWFLRPYDNKELVARIYKLKYNTQEKITSDSAAASAPQTASSSSIASGNNSGPDTGLSLQGVTTIFKSDPKQLVDDIKSLLGIPTTGFQATNAGEVTVDSPASLGMPPSSVQPQTGLVGTNVGGEPNGPQVIWNSDSNTLYIVATRQQQEWVAGYLVSMDRPQPLIAIEVKFLETNKDPREKIGIDWSGTLEEGFTVAARDIRATPNGQISVETNRFSDELSGTLPPGQVPYDSQQNTRRAIVESGMPYSAVLSASDVAVTLQAFLRDRDTSQVQYPRVLTRNNREVVIRSVINQPVLASSSSVTQGIGGTTAASIAYLPIGTIINVLPKEMSDGSIALNVTISISNIINEVPISGSLYPVASTRVFSAALSVTSGYTLAIGGLDEADDVMVRNGVPFLKDIPLLGEAFKSKDRSQRKKNLILFITPTLLPHSGVRGIAETPKSLVPERPGQPTPPAFSVEGFLVGGRNAVAGAVTWVQWRAEILQSTVTENLTNQTTIDEINGLAMLCDRLLTQIDLLIEAFPDQREALTSSASSIELAQSSLRKLSSSAQKNFLRF